MTHLCPTRSHCLAPARASRAFTLIELLVVVSLIVMLVAMLIPALGAARKTARTAVCASNQRQLTSATREYVHDYLWWPQPSRDADIADAAARERAIWYNAVDPYLGLPVLNYTSTVKNDDPIKQDPIWNNDLSTAQQASNRTIKLNDHFGLGSDGSAAKFYSSQMPRQPALTVVYVDGRAVDLYPTDTGTAGHFHALEATVGLRHNDGANVSFGDGHVALVMQPVSVSGTGKLGWFADSVANYPTLQQLVWDITIER